MLRAVVDALCLVLSLFGLAWGVAAQPDRADCGPDMFSDGIRPSGAYTCLRKPGGDPRFDGAGGSPDRTIDRPGWRVGRIWCTGGTQPVAWSDGRHYGCQR